MKQYTKKKIDDVVKMTLEALQGLIASGVKPWSQPWQNSGILSYATGKPYSMLNEFLICWEKIVRKIDVDAHDEFCTYWQLMQEGETALAAVKGKKGYHIFKPKPCHYFRSTGKVDDNGEEVIKEYSFTRFLPEVVFSRSELGLPYRHAPKTHHHDKIAEAEAIISAYVKRTGLIFEPKASGNRAFSESKRARVEVPCMERFKSAEAYYSTVFHELTHSTEHFGCERECCRRYAESPNWRAQEELVAELGAASLCALCGMKPVENEQSAAYLASWGKALTVESAKAFMQAMTHAQKAIACILGKAEEEATPEPASTETAQAPEPAPEPAEKKRVKREPVAAVPAGDLFGWARIA